MLLEWHGTGETDTLVLGKNPVRSSVLVPRADFVQLRERSTCTIAGTGGSHHCFAQMHKGPPAQTVHSDEAFAATVWINSTCKVTENKIYQKIGLLDLWSLAVESVKKKYPWNIKINGKIQVFFEEEKKAYLDKNLQSSLTSCFNLKKTPPSQQTSKPFAWCYKQSRKRKGVDLSPPEHNLALAITKLERWRIKLGIFFVILWNLLFLGSRPREFYNSAHVSEGPKHHNSAFPPGFICPSKIMNTHTHTQSADV